MPGTAARYGSPGYEGERERVRGKTKGRRGVILKRDRYASPSRALLLLLRALCLRLPRSPRPPSPLPSFSSLIYTLGRSFHPSDVPLRRAITPLCRASGRV